MHFLIIFAFDLVPKSLRNHASYIGKEMQEALTIQVSVSG
ncbi:hypothetical protein C408_4226 [Vibrio diabolicus E0666]|nr:hypothetical protein C408_4226 [Vibrio diabolicus E0666]